uniref:hypothetical protein n=1 Tax=Roseburia inulinivorans TaxID=360807 RepID=UPI004038D0BD
MAIKPILFNTEMVLAILDGRKTCTRRICKDANECTVPDMEFYNADKRTYAVHNFADKKHTEQLSIAERTCPICPGDILYVRETWMDYAGLTMYKADCDIYRLDSLNFAGFGWKPSIRMPKEAARIWLKVTDVRVERLQEINAESALAEGADKYIHTNGELDENMTITSFIGIWNSTIKKSDLDCYGWDASPWVWVIEFERCEKPEGV